MLGRLSRCIFEDSSSLVAFLQGTMAEKERMKGRSDAFVGLGAFSKAFLGVSAWFQMVLVAAGVVSE